MSKRRKTMYQPRSARMRRQALLKMGVWIFLLAFVFSIVGVAVVFVTGTANR
jgi:hypothetical protein